MVKKSSFKNLSPLEEELLQKAPIGQMIGQMVLPEEEDASKRVRADLLHALLLGEIDDVPLHPKGARLRAAWIDGDLDFEGCEFSRPVKLFTCRFSGEVVFLDAHVPSLYLSGSDVANLILHRLRSDGDVHLRQGFRAQAGVNLGGAQITGSLTCDGGHFENVEGRALHCNGMTVGADVFLRDGFQATGNLNLRRARITGNLQIIKAEINGLVDLQSGRVDEGFFWKNISGDVTTLDLTDTSVGVLRDDLESWDAVKRSRLKGFRYDGIDSDIRVRYQIEHLAPTKDQVATFDPQPHTQLAKTLSTHGQPVGAARVRF
ncbi:MAG: hypothetical protein P8Q50_09655 [Octadecabacter sp.]|nr:hypothetical protein [Octadecabacter sp.]